MPSGRIQDMINQLRECGYLVEPPKKDECPHRGDVSASVDMIKGTTQWHCRTCGERGEHKTGDTAL